MSLKIQSRRDLNIGRRMNVVKNTIPWGFNIGRKLFSQNK